ncbi:hypothetical protein D3C87_999020 [compost metagenome]
MLQFAAWASFRQVNGQAYVIGQRLQERMIETVLCTRHPAERFCAITKGLISRPILDQIAFDRCCWLTDAVEHCAGCAALANFQAQCLRPSWQLFQSKQCQPSAVC